MEKQDLSKSINVPIVILFAIFVSTALPNLAWLAWLAVVVIALIKFFNK